MARAPVHNRVQLWVGGSMTAVKVAPQARAAGMHGMMHMGPMFALSPEDKAAGGHDLGH
jgi:hypothetical protein